MTDTAVKLLSEDLLYSMKFSLYVQYQGNQTNDCTEQTSTYKITSATRKIKTTRKVSDIKNEFKLNKLQGWVLIAFAAVLTHWMWISMSLVETKG